MHIDFFNETNQVINVTSTFIFLPNTNKLYRNYSIQVLKIFINLFQMNRAERNRMFGLVEIFRKKLQHCTKSPRLFQDEKNKESCYEDEVNKILKINQRQNKIIIFIMVLDSKCSKLLLELK
jgi:hypothetical protein